MLDDSVQYLTLAHNLTDTGTFSLSFSGLRAPTAERLPGYPILLSAFTWSPAALIVLQHIAVLLTGLFVYRIARRYTAHGRLVAAAYLLQPYPILFASFLMPETVFILLTVWAIERFIAQLHQPSRLKLLTISVLLSLATLTKGLALPLLLAFVLWAVYRSARLRVLGVALALLPAAMIVGLWSARNHTELGINSLTRGTHTAFWYGRLGGMLALANNTPPTDANFIALADSFGRAALDAAGQPKTPLYTFETSREALESAKLHPTAAAAGKAYVLSHPVQLVELHAVAFWQMAKGVGYRSARLQSGSDGLAKALAGLQFVCNGLMLMALIAGIGLWRSQPEYNTLLLFVIGSFILLHAAIWADGRYRLVADPCFVLLLPNLIVLVNRLAGRRRDRRGRRP